MAACLRCRTLKRKCEITGQDSVCDRCARSSSQCEWQSAPEPKRIKLAECRISEEQVFAKMFRDNDQTRPQFVCSTQPLALLLSRDSILCFDGDAYGLFYPWRGGLRPNVERDEDLIQFLDTKGAFRLPPIAEQRYLVSLFLDNLYPFYPVVNRNIIDNLHDVPLLLLNALFLTAVRLDKRISLHEVRPRLAEFFQRCKWLELIENNKVVLIQLYLLLSLHEEGMEGMTSSKQYISRATNLCGELCITNLGADSGENILEASSGSSDQNYTKPLLRRIFWTALCLDRIISATSGREMSINRKDLLVDRIMESDFDDGPQQCSDYTVFSLWLSICEFVERILCALYRPPQNRSVDPTITEEVNAWRPPSVVGESYTACIAFLKVGHSYAQLLVLGRAIDSISLMLCDEESLHSAESLLSQIHKCSEETLRLVDPQYINHNVILVHAVVHVIALLQLECKISPDAGKPEFVAYCSSLSRNSLRRLQSLRHYWWYAGTAQILCQDLFDLNKRDAT